MDIEQVLSQAELYIRQNQTSQARVILGEVLHEAPQNEEAWILSAQVSDKPEQVMYCLRQAIKINPGSSRARLLLDRLQHTQPSPASLASSQPAPYQEPDTQPHRPLPSAIDSTEEVTRISSVPQYSVPNSPVANGQTSLAGEAAVPARQRAAQVAASRRPMRWLIRIFTLAGSACLLAPWILIQSGSAPSALSGVQILYEAIRVSLGLDEVIAILAALALPILIFFCFQSSATQKWGERATIALAPLAALLSLDLISSFYAGLTGILELRWGIWACCTFYSLAGFTALINALRLGRLSRAELSSARAGMLFTWLCSLSDILAILVTIVGLAMIGKFSLVGIAFPFIWLAFGALLSLLA